jgi:type II secretory pathway component PulF
MEKRHPVSRFRYRAARHDGQLVSGRLAAESAGAATTALLARGLAPVDVRADEAGPGPRSAGRRELAVVFRSLASLAGAGLPLERAIAATTPLAGGKLRPLLVDVRQAVHRGVSVAAALDAGNGLVPGVVIGMIRAGERSGRLTLALERAASHLEQEAELLGRLRQALAYPLMLAITGTVSVLVIGTVVVPRFAALLADQGQSLPLATRILLASSALLTRHGVALAVILGAIGLVLYRIARRPGATARIHEMLLAAPVVGPVRHALASGRCCRALASTLQSGMPVLPALAAATEAAGDVAVAALFGRARERVTRGEPVARSLEHEAAIVPVCVQLLAVGEAGGRLAELAERAATVAATEGERTLRSLVTMIEPLCIILFGGIVIFVAMALLQAVYGLRPA